MKKTFITFLALLYIVAFGDNYLLASDNYHLLKKGNEERALGNLTSAASYYQEYIESHPISNETGQKRSTLQNRQFLLRNLLFAYNYMLDGFRENKNYEKQDFWLKKLMSIHQPEKFRSKNRYTLARLLYENNRPGESILLLEKIIVDQVNDYWEGNIKVFLRAASKLEKIYAEQGNTAALADLHKNLSQCFLTDFDANDKYKLATILLSHEQTKQKGEQILKSILENSTDANSGKLTFLKSSMLLMVEQHKEKDITGLKKTFILIQEAINGNNSPSTLYRLAMTYYEIQKTSEGEAILKDISERFPNTVWARKSLFLLGRNALSGKNWDEAIEYFSTYIEKYPQQTFFCLKAYSNLLNAYWARDGNLKEQQIDISQFADILNETSNYETQLNMARELQYKGFDVLAEATFTLGYTYAQEIILKTPHSMQAMRANWQLTKYAYELGKIDLARESGESVVAQHQFLQRTHMGMDSTKRADHYLSRTYLWLAKIYADEGKKKEAQDVLQHFVTEFPGDSDTSYAAFQLAEMYQQDLKPEKAIKHYKDVTKGRWKDKAAKALKRMGAQ